MAVLTLDPTNGSIDVESSEALATRPAGLRGQVLGIVANGIGDSEIMFDALSEILTQTDDLGGVVKVVKASVAVPPSVEQWMEITDHATVAVTGFGGCGSCSTRSMRDALDLEALGIPAVCVVHEALVPAVRAIAKFLGKPDYPIVTVGYPLDPTAHWSKADATALATDIAAAVRARLTSQS